MTRDRNGESDTRALAEIRRIYDQELDKIFGRLETRGITISARRGRAE